VLATVAAVAAVGVLSATLRSRRPDSEAAAAPFTVNDSRRPDSAPPAVVAPPPRPVVEIVAPGEATVSVNGTDVGRGRWRSDTLKPGQYVLAASVRSLTRCGSARAVDTIYVRETGDTSVTLQPRPCGYLGVASSPEVAEYEVMAWAGASRLRQGILPLPDSLLLPVGLYRLRLRARYCTQFEDSVRIEPGKTNRQQIKMLCDTTETTG
jgi:hypothetical protein